MRRVLGAIVVLLAGGLAGLVGPSSPACACSCMAVTEKEAFDRATTVFSATLVHRDGQVDGRPSTDPVTMKFAVDAVYKGDVSAVQEIETAMSSASCGLEIPVGARYLVHARPAEDGLTLQTTLCDGNRELDGTPVVAGVPAKPIAAVTKADKEGGNGAAQPATRSDSSDRSNNWSGVALGGVAGLVTLAGIAFALVLVVRRRRA